MLGKYTPAEIVRIAVAVEENGRTFYDAMGKMTSNREMNALLQYLAEQEMMHVRTFRDLADTIDDIMADAPGASGEYEAYFRAVASEFILTSQIVKEKMARGFASDIEVVNFAMQLEKDSILTYLALKKYIAFDKQSPIDKVIAEEERHLVRLTAMRDKMVSYGK